MAEVSTLSAERQRLEQQRDGTQNWRLWGPYLALRAWGTVREDYSADGNAAAAFTADQAPLRTYRWSEDGLAGLSDENQHLCFALALWNGCDAQLKERLAGSPGGDGSGAALHDRFLALDATPSLSFLRCRFTYAPAGATGFVGEVSYAKAAPAEIHIRIIARNCSESPAELHLLPTLWFRNTWTWDEAPVRPLLRSEAAPLGAAWAVRADHGALGRYHLYGRQPAHELFTENDSNEADLWGGRNAQPFVKDAFHRRVIGQQADAVNPGKQGSKFAAWHRFALPPLHAVRLDLVLSAQSLATPFARSEAVFAARAAEADAYFAGLLPNGSEEDRRLLRRAAAALLWSQQFYHYDVQRWLEGDRLPPPPLRWQGRNSRWTHLRAADVLPVAEGWAAPGFAAAELAMHCAGLAEVDIDGAKQPLALLLSERFLHPNGTLPASERNFSEAVPPLHALAVLHVFRAERRQRGAGDRRFLERAFHKLLLVNGAWINRIDADGRGVFEGGGRGDLQPGWYPAPPPGSRLTAVETLGWSAAAVASLIIIALELAIDNDSYEDVAIQLFEQFMAIAFALAGGDGGLSCWDGHDGWFKDVVTGADGRAARVNVIGFSGLVPLLASEVMEARLLARVPRFRAKLSARRGGRWRGRFVAACPDLANAAGDHVLGLVDPPMLQPIIARLMDEAQLLSEYGVRSLSRHHARQPHAGDVPGLGPVRIDYAADEAPAPPFTGCSPWRGAISPMMSWLLIAALQRLGDYYGSDVQFPVAAAEGLALPLAEIAARLAERLLHLFRARPEPEPKDDARAAAPLSLATAAAADGDSRPVWFHQGYGAESGQGLGAGHHGATAAAVIALLIGQANGRDRFAD